MIALNSQSLWLQTCFCEDNRAGGAAGGTGVHKIHTALKNESKFVDPCNTILYTVQ